MRLHRRSFGFEGKVDGHHVIIRRSRMSKPDRQQCRTDGMRAPYALWSVEIDGMNKRNRCMAPSWSLLEARAEALTWLEALRPRKAA